MAQHFLLSSAAKTLSLATVLRMTEEEAETVFRRVRWASTGGAAVCPHCDCPITYECRRPSGALRFRCKACRKDFSITSGTIFASHKMPLRNYLAAIAIFVNEVKGKSALALSRDLGTAYKTAFVLAHKLRKAMANEIKSMSEILAQITAHHFCAGLVIRGARCTAAAPILAWAIGRPRDELRAYFARKGWRAVVIEGTRQTNDRTRLKGAY